MAFPFRVLPFPCSPSNSYIKKNYNKRYYCFTSHCFVHPRVSYPHELPTFREHYLLEKLGGIKEATFAVLAPGYGRNVFDRSILFVYYETGIYRRHIVSRYERLYDAPYIDGVSSRGYISSENFIPRFQEHFKLLKLHECMIKSNL